jgi:hypothetical protein
MCSRRQLGGFMNDLIYLIGLNVAIMAILFLGLH